MPSTSEKKQAESSSLSNNNFIKFGCNERAASTILFFINCPSAAQKRSSILRTFSNTWYKCRLSIYNLIHSPTDTRNKPALCSYLNYIQKSEGISCCLFSILALGSHLNRTNRFDTHAGVYTNAPKSVREGTNTPGTPRLPIYTPVGVTSAFVLN